MKILLAVLIAAALGAVAGSVFADDAVDLQGKQGVVDPKDLKKDDPKEKPLKIKEPPPPEKVPDVPPYEVKKSGDTTEHHHVGKE